MQSGPTTKIPDSKIRRKLTAGHSMKQFIIFYILTVLIIGCTQPIRKADTLMVRLEEYSQVVKNTKDPESLNYRAKSFFQQPMEKAIY
jgi:hypothetical protein